MTTFFWVVEDGNATAAGSSIISSSCFVTGCETTAAFVTLDLTGLAGRADLFFSRIAIIAVFEDGYKIKSTNYKGNLKMLS